MKKYLLLIAGMFLLAACSTPKYAYYFDHYDYNSGKKKAESPKTITAQNILATPEMSPLQINQDAVVASAESRIKKVENVPATANEKKSFAKKYAAMSKTEKRELRKELKSEIKKIIKAKKSGDNVNSIADIKVMERDLKMALIFGILGILLTAFAGVNPVFWILGVISAVIAIVFLISWIADQ